MLSKMSASLLIRLVNRAGFNPVAVYYFNNVPVGYVPKRFDKYRKLSVISGIVLPLVYLLMPAPKRRINIELLLGVSATFLSLAALVVSIFQTKIAREQQQASVWPHLQADYSKTDNEFVWNIINNGIGPAIIRSVAVHYRGREYRDAYQLMNEQIQLFDKNTKNHKTVHVNLFYGGVFPGNVIKADGELTLGRLSENEGIADSMARVIRDSTYHFIVNYSDVYGNCWQLDGDKVTAIGECPQP